MDAALHLEGSRECVWRAGAVRNHLETVDAQFVEHLPHHIRPVEQAAAILRHLVGLAQAPAVDADEAQTKCTRKVVVERDQVPDGPQTQEHNDGPSIHLAKVGE